MLHSLDFDITKDFHAANTHVRVMIPESIDIPSKHMWALFLYGHPDSKLFNETPEVRKSLVLEYIKDDTFSFEYYKDIIAKIEDRVLTKAQKSLMVWENKLHQRERVLNELEYTLANYSQLDKMVSDTSKLWQHYEVIKKVLTAEASQTFGDQEESLSEKNLI